MAAVHVSVTGHNSDLILFKPIEPFLLLVCDIEDDDDEFLGFQVPICTNLGGGAFFALAPNFVTVLSKRDACLILSISNGFRRGLVFTACASIRIKNAPTKMGSKGRRLFRRNLRTFLRRDTMQAGGFIAKQSSW